MKKRLREVVTLKVPSLNGVRARVLRKSRLTGAWTVQLLEGKGGYITGNLVVVMPYDCMFTGEKS